MIARLFLFLALAGSVLSLLAVGGLGGMPARTGDRAALVAPFLLLGWLLACQRLPPGWRREAAFLGAGPWAAFRHVALPLCGPRVAAGWVAAIAFIAMPDRAMEPTAATEALARALDWTPFALLVLVTYAGLLPHRAPAQRTSG